MPEQLRLFSPAIIALGRGMEKMKRLAFAEARKEFEEALISQELTKITQRWKQAADYWLGGMRDIDSLAKPGNKAKRWCELWDTFLKDNLPWREQILADMRQHVFAQIVGLWQTDPVPLPYPIGYFQWETGDLEGAIRSLEADLQVDPRTPLIHLLLANVYYGKGEIITAARHYREAFLRKPLHGFEIEIKHSGLRGLWEEFEDEGVEWGWFPVYATLRGILPLPYINSWDEAREVEAQARQGEPADQEMDTSEISNKAKLFLAYLQMAHWCRKQGAKQEIEYRRKMKSLNPLLFELYLERL
jgi:tetratricopeptide (TPR) repeat protein